MKLWMNQILRSRQFKNYFFLVIEDKTIGCITDVLKYIQIIKLLLVSCTTAISYQKCQKKCQNAIV